VSDGCLNLTTLLVRMRAGDADAADRAMGALYTELRRIAGRRMRGEAPNHTLQPTALINEAYLRLMHGPDVVNNRQHFLALAAQAMRRVLVDHARQRRSKKRGGDFKHVTLVDDRAAAEPYRIDVLALDEALAELATLDPRAARVVELRFFGGHTDEEVCRILGQNLSRVRRDWVFARTWLQTRFAPVASA
jgi:RNA polymerase sigma factor (TIGR02999 family)